MSSHCLPAVCGREGVSLMLLNRLRGPSLAVLTCALGALSLSACATTGDAAPKTETALASSSRDRTMAPGLDGWANTDPYPST